MTADQIKALFDANWVMIMFAAGLAWKYIPALDKWWNHLIPYLGTAMYILAKVLGPQDANAADGTAVANGVGVVIGGFTNSMWAKLLYDAFAKPLIEKFFGRHPSDIRHDKERGLTVNATKAAGPLTP